MRISGLLALVLLILAGQSFVDAANEDPVRVATEQCTDEWTGTITLRVISKRQGTAENNVNVSHWNEEGFYEATAQLNGRRNEHGRPVALVRANAHEKKEWGSRGKGVCYRETDHSQAVQGEAYEDTTAISISFNPRNGEYSVLAPTLMVYASGQYVQSSRVKGRCNNPYNKDFNQVEKIERFQLSEDAPALIGRGRIDPAKPGEFSGTETAEHDTRRGKKSVTLKWNLRCGKQ